MILKMESLKSLRIKKRVIRVPENGIIKTKFKPSYGISSDEYFMVNKDGSRSQIYLESNTKNNTDVCIYSSITSKKYVDDKNHEIEGFMVCRLDSVEYFNDHKIKTN